MIGKTRQHLGPVRGVLRAALTPDGDMEHMRRAPAPEIAPWIAHYWGVSWDLRSPFTAETVPHPNVHLVFDENGVRVHGVATAKFSTVLRGKSKVFGVKFRPGGFRPFYTAAVAALAGKTIAFPDLFDPTCEAADEYFRTHLPEPDETVSLAGAIVDKILKDQTIRTVDQLAARTGIQKRSLQRLFNEYVGASPKWVIRRYRLHEAVERIHAGAAFDMADLALQLGYYDQAHLIEDFKSIVGLTPGQYAGLVTRQGQGSPPPQEPGR